MSEPATSERLEIAIREMKPEDEAFVFSTWLHATKRSTYEAKRIRDAVFYRRRHALYERIMRRGSVLVAHLPEDPDTILGYVVAEPLRSPPVLHFAFTKLPWRRFGIATSLIEAAIPDPNKAVFTCYTVWSLAVPAPKGIDRNDRRAVREGRFSAVREAERNGDAGGDTEDIVRRYPGLTYDPDARWEE